MEPHCRRPRFPADPALTRGRAALLGRHLARATEVCREILEFRQSVLDGQAGLLIIHVHGRHEFQIRKLSGKDIDQLERRMLGKQMSAAYRAPLAKAHRRLVVGADEFRAAGDGQRRRRPQGEGVDRATRPLPAGRAVAEPHDCGVAADGERHCATKTTSLVIAHWALLAGTRFGSLNLSEGTIFWSANRIVMPKRFAQLAAMTASLVCLAGSAVAQQAPNAGAILRQLEPESPAAPVPKVESSRQAASPAAASGPLIHVRTFRIEGNQRIPTAKLQALLS